MTDKTLDVITIGRSSVDLYGQQIGTRLEDIGSFMAEAFDTEDAGYIAHALGVVARAKGMSEIARDTGLSREQLYRSFSAKGNPTLKTTLAVMKALGLELTTKVQD